MIMKPWKCPHCPYASAQKFNLNKHIKLVHNESKRKNMKYIKKDGRVLCPVCGKDFSRGFRLKDHIIKNHNSRDL